MSDAPNVASEAGGDATAAPKIDEKPPAVAEKPLLTTGDDDAGEGGDDTAPQSDWRDRVAKAAGVGEDAKYRAWLNRFSSEENYHKAVPKLRRDFSANRTQPDLPEGATPEEIVAHRKALGIPEKPDGYGLAFPEQLKPTEADMAGLSAWADYAHEHYLPPAAAKLGAEFYANLALQGRAAREEAAKEATLQGIAELRGEWKGREFTRNLTIGNEFIIAHGGDFAPDLVNLDLADGRKLGDHPLFIRLAVAAGRATADEEALVGGDGGGGGKSLDDEYKALIDTGASRRLSDSENKRLHELAEARHAREQRQGRSRAA